MKSLSYRQRVIARHRRVRELWQAGVPPAQIAKRLGYKWPTNVHIIINAHKKTGYAWRRRTSRAISKMLAGTDPVQRKMVLKALA